MSRPITQPINQVRLTNVAVVRMNKSGKRFEIACYRNKVVNYRQGLETDLSEVLQTERVFTNVSKGQFAKLTDVEAVFGTRNEVDVCRIILEKGMVQVGDLERAEQLESVQRDIATWIANHCVHSKTQRPYTMSQIRQAMHESNFVVHNPATRPLKRQYLDCIKSLQTVLLELERAKMELALIVPLRHVRKLQQQVNEEWGLSMTTTTTTTTTSQSTLSSTKDDNVDVDDDDNVTTKTKTTFTLLVDPSMYRQLDELCKSMDGCQLQIIQQVVMNQDDVNLETEVEHHQQRQQALLELESLSLSSSPAAAIPVAGAARNATPVLASVASSKEDAHFQQGLQLKDHDDDHHHDDDDEDDDDESSENEKDEVPQTKKSQRQNNKKSKKAKRREKEDLLERQARMEAERQRREEREQHLQEQQEPSSSSSNYYYNTTTGGSSVGTTSVGSASASSSAAAAAAKSCNTCGGAFATAADYRAHFKSDWHRFNQKLKLQGKMAISEQEFLLCDADML